MFKDNCSIALALMCMFKDNFSIALALMCIFKDNCSIALALLCMFKDICSGALALPQRPQDHVVLDHVVVRLRRRLAPFEVGLVLYKRLQCPRVVVA